MCQDRNSIESRRSLGIGYFIHPIPLGAVVILAFNDHYLKFAYPSFVTGKLSDLVGVFVFPILLCALWNLVSNIRDHLISRGRFQWITHRQVFVAIVVTDLIFIGVKVVPQITVVYVGVMEILGFPSRVTRDTSDLVAIGMNVFTWLYVDKQIRR